MRRINPRLAHRRPELSQHFLRNADVARALVRRMALEPSDLVVDAGAGDGALTQALAEIGCNVIAVEKDERLYRLLARRFADRPNVACRHADILTFPLPITPYHVVSNVPYAITAALMHKLLHAARPPDSAALIVQRGHGPYGLVRRRGEPAQHVVRGAAIESGVVQRAHMRGQHIVLWLVRGRDADVVRQRRGVAATHDVLDERHATEGRERLARHTRGAHA